MLGWQRDVAKESAPRSRAVRPVDAGPHSGVRHLADAGVLDLQRTAGNTAVLQFLQVAAPQTYSQIAVQRCGPIPCDCSAEEQEEHARAHGADGHESTVQQLIVAPPVIPSLQRAPMTGREQAELLTSVLRHSARRAFEAYSGDTTDVGLKKSYAEVSRVLTVDIDQALLLLQRGSASKSAWGVATQLFGAAVPLLKLMNGRKLAATSDVQAKLSALNLALQKQGYKFPFEAVESGEVDYPGRIAPKDLARGGQLALAAAQGEIATGMRQLRAARKAGKEPASLPGAGEVTKHVKGALQQFNDALAGQRPSDPGHQAVAGAFTKTADACSTFLGEGPTLAGAAELLDAVNFGLKGFGLQERSMPFGPATTKNRADEGKRTQIKGAAFTRLQGIARDFINEGFASAQNGARTPVNLPDVVGQQNFYTALAGNLLWAATSFFAKWHPVVIVMSFVGATIGSGASSKSDEITSVGFAAIADRLAKEADDLEKTVKPDVWSVANDCGEQLVTEVEAQDRLLWAKLVPSVPYDGRREAITKATRARVEKAMPDYVRQWKIWDDTVKQCTLFRPVGSSDPDELEIAASPRGDREPASVQALSPDVQRFTIIPPVFGKSRTRKECEERHPFSPVLKF
jgi:hypothetical protein